MTVPAYQTSDCDITTNDTGNDPSIRAAVSVSTGMKGRSFDQALPDKFGLKDPIAGGMATASRFVGDPSHPHRYCARYCSLCDNRWISSLEELKIYVESLLNCSSRHLVGSRERS